MADDLASGLRDFLNVPTQQPVNDDVAGALRTFFQPSPDRAQEFGNLFQSESQRQASDGDSMDESRQRFQQQFPSVDFSQIQPDLQQAVKQEQQRQKFLSARAAVASKPEDVDDYIWERAPFFGAVAGGVKAYSLRESAQNIQDDKAKPIDYEILARHSVAAERYQNSSFGRKLLDEASYLPGAVSEWILSGGLAGAGRAAAENAAAKVFGSGALARAGRWGAGVATEGAIRTLANPAAIAGQTAQRMAPDTAVDQSGQSYIGQPKPLEEAATNAVLSKFIENSVFSGGHFPGMSNAAAEGISGRLFQGAKDTLAGVATAQANEEAQYQAGLSPQSSALRRIGDPQGRQDLLLELGSFALIEGAKQSWGAMRKSTLAPNSAKSQEAVADSARAFQRAAMAEFSKQTDGQLAALVQDLRADNGDQGDQFASELAKLRQTTGGPSIWRKRARPSIE